MAFITINRENYYYNLNQIALKTGSIEKIAVVLKDNAYGHGLNIMAQLAREFGIKHAVVKSISEAQEIQSLFTTVLVLNDKIIAHSIYSFAINALEDIEKAQIGSRIELKVDTGMHRNGISMNEVDKALHMIKEKQLNLIGVMTHYRSADVLSSELFWQRKNFEIVKDKIKQHDFKNIRFHSSNSAAILRSKNFDEDMVRVGIAMYGYNELPLVFDNVTVKPVLSLYAKKTATRVLQKFQRVGYAGDFEANTDMTVSTYDLGYGDGWFRGDSKYPYKTTEGLDILGKVSMDFITLASEKDEILVMNHAQKAAKHFGTISYEITTALSKNIERTIC